MSFDRLIELAKKKGPARVAIVGAAAEEVLVGADRARSQGLCDPVLIGDAPKIQEFIDRLDVGFESSDIVGVSDDEEGARVAMQMVREGNVEVLMKGRIPTWVLMRVGLREGLRRDGRLLSHVSLLEVEKLGKSLLTTDGALTPYPTFDQFIQIIKNGVETMRRLGVEEPKVALLSASEEVNPKIPWSEDAARLSALNTAGGELEGWGTIEGPYDLGCALDEHTAQIKGAKGSVAGRADVLVSPDIVSSNVLTKALIYLSGAKIAACVVGGTVPIAMVSRASSAEDKYSALIMGLACR